MGRKNKKQGSLWAALFIFFQEKTQGFALGLFRVYYNVCAALAKVKEKFAQYDITDIDGVKIDFPDKWVHLRKSNTEPIIRIYSEAHTMQEAEELGGELIQIIHEMCK